MAREIMMAAREGGGDPEANPRLRLALERARQFAVPSDNIERAIKRGTGEIEGQTYEEITYEGYGPGGVALMLQVVTDNRNRTASEIRHLFSRHGGNLGEAGCVAWMFERKGLIVIDREEANGISEDELLMAALEANAEDFRVSDELFEVVTAPQDLDAVRQALQAVGVEQFSSDQLTMVPSSQVQVAGREAEQLLRLLDALEDHDDVQEVYGNYDIAEEALVAYDS